MNASNIVSSRTKCFRHGCFRRLVLAFLIMLIAAPSGFGVDYYVAVEGKDTADGISLTTPLATLQKAIGQAAPGDTIHVRGGTYRQQVTATARDGTAGVYLTIQAYGDERPVFKGSDVVTGWEHHEGAIWKKTGWAYNSQQVFCNERHFQQIGLPHSSYLSYQYTPVGTGIADMVPGSFYYDATATTPTLYVWLHDGGDPNDDDAIMEVSTRKWVLAVHAIPFVHIKGLAVRHCNSSAANPGGTAVSIGSDSIIENCDIQWCDFEGLGLRSRAQAIHCTISNNGDVGVGANSVENILVRGCAINGNNYRNFNQWWHAGGLKIVGNTNGTIEESEISHNNGNGVWFDGCHSGNPIVIRNNRFHENTKCAIFVEISNNASVYNNLLIINPYAGISISGSDDTRCYHNTIVTTSTNTAIWLGGVPRERFTLKNNRVFNNIVYGSTNANDLVIPQDNGGDTGGNFSDYNCYYRPDGVLKLSNGVRTYSSLETWRAATGFDLHSISADPRFNLTTADDYSTSTMSPVVDAGMNLSEVATDILGRPRPQGVASDMGAFETYWQDAEPPSAPLNTAADLIAWNRVRVSWSPASDNVGVVSYDVYRDGTRRANTTETEFVDDGLAALTSYRYSVIAIDAAGLQSARSEVTEIRTGAPDTTAPSQPLKPFLIAKSAFEISIAWGAATDNVGVTEYKIYQNGLEVGVSASTGFTDAGLKPSTKYDYQISALDAAGNESKASKSLQVRTSPMPVLSQIEQWRFDYFGSPTNSGDAADAFDFDRDGSANFVEYALGRNPTAATGDDGPLGMPDPELDVAADRLVLVIDLPATAPAEVVYEVLASSDLVNWTLIAQKTGAAAWVKIDAGGSIVPGPVLGGRQITKVQDSVSMTAQSRRMMTLRLAGVSVATATEPPVVAVDEGGAGKAAPPGEPAKETRNPSPSEHLPALLGLPHFSPL